MQRTRGFPDPILSFLPSRAGVSQVGLRSLLPEVVEEVLHCLYRAATGRDRVHAAKSPPTDDSNRPGVAREGHVKTDPLEFK